MSLYYQDESVTLYHGSCIERTEWLGADVLVTDPPYGIAWRAGATTSYRKYGGTYQQELRTIAHDQNPEIRDAVLNLWGERAAIVFGSWRVEKPKNVQHRLIWHKKGQAPGPANFAFMSQDEEIYILGTGFRKSSPPMRSVIATSEARAVEVARIGHPTPKPIGLMELLIDRCPAGVIADPFSGSGSTLVAARNQGRKAIGVELEERYCEIIANRLSQAVLDFG